MPVIFGPGALTVIALGAAAGDPYFAALLALLEHIEGCAHCTRATGRDALCPTGGELHRRMKAAAPLYVGA